ncbi:MAG TPA: glycosyltransferase, partial [Puia sp.]|nr:glycosyltransferase [Puia sp.]
LRETLESIYLRTRYRSFEVVVVTNSRLIAYPPASALIPAEGPAAGTSGRQAPPVYVPYDKPYNFSDKCNQGALHAKGEILIFLNDDVRPLQDDWLENTIEYLFIPGVGGVSPKLIYEDDSIQYAGMASGVRGLTGTTFHGYPKDSTAYINFPQSVRNVSILSGACLAIRKDVFLHIGGFDSVNTPSAHSDVDLSFKLLDAGSRLVYTPYATLRHIGHLSLRAHDETPAGRAKDKADIFLLRRWAQRVADDPYFSPSMRSYLYHDSPEPYRIYSATGHEPRARSNAHMVSGLTADGSQLTAPPDVLLVSHDLSLSGAPVMLLQLCRLLIHSGYFVTVICEKEGPIGKMFLQSGAPVIIDSLLLRQHETLTRFARNFDHVICNTVVTWPVVKQLGQLTHTIWWLHEAKIIGTFAEDPAFAETLSNARNVIGPSEYALNYIRKFNPYPQKIYYGYPGTLPVQPQPAQINGKLVFSLVGSIEPRKGQDVLVVALRQLDAALLSHVEIWIIGRPHDPSFHSELLQIIRHFPNIKVIGECDHQQCLDLMAASDVIVCPSRDDPFPVVIVEALCLSKPCIVSSNTGFAELITDGANGYVIPSEDSNALAMKISRIVQHPQDLVPIRHAARQLYERYMTMEAFKEKFLALLAPPGQPASPKQKSKTLLWQD